MTGFAESLQFPAVQQVRGKKKVAKATTIKVKLLRNVAGFGKKGSIMTQCWSYIQSNVCKGSIVPVPPGTMRNTWFPSKMAEYMTLAKLKELGDVVIERDTTFGGVQERELARQRKEAEQEKARRTQETTSQLFGLATPVEAAVPIEQSSPIESAAPLQPPVSLEPEELSV